MEHFVKSELGWLPWPEIFKEHIVEPHQELLARTLQLNEGSVVVLWLADEVPGLVQSAAKMNNITSIRTGWKAYAQ